MQRWWTCWETARPRRTAHGSLSRVRLSPAETDKLVLHQAGVLAQKRLARGLRLNYPEAVALIATQLLEFIRDGKSVADVMSLGKRLLGRCQVMDGIPELIAEVQVEGTFPDGSKLVTVHQPIAAEHGDLSLALYGSFLPVPELTRFVATPQPFVPGEITAQPGELELNEGRRTTSLSVTNTGDRPIQVGRATRTVWSSYCATPRVNASTAAKIRSFRAFGGRSRPASRSAVSRSIPNSSSFASAASVMPSE